MLMAFLLSWQMPVTIRSYSQAKLQWLQPAENLFRCIYIGHLFFSHAVCPSLASGLQLFCLTAENISLE